MNSAKLVRVVVTGRKGTLAITMQYEIPDYDQAKVNAILLAGPPKIPATLNEMTRS